MSSGPTKRVLPSVRHGSRQGGEDAVQIAITVSSTYLPTRATIHPCQRPPLSDHLPRRRRLRSGPAAPEELGLPKEPASPRMWRHRATTQPGRSRWPFCALRVTRREDPPGRTRGRTSAPSQGRTPPRPQWDVGTRVSIKSRGRRNAPRESLDQFTATEIALLKEELEIKDARWGTCSRGSFLAGFSAGDAEPREGPA